MLRRRSPRHSSAMSPLPCALPTLLLTAYLASFASAGFLQSRSATIPAPVSWQANENFQGIDGSWSSWTIGIGNPVQYVPVFPSTAVEQTWTVIAAGCPSVSVAGSYAATCNASRGPFFDPADSSTWEFRGYYNLAIDSWLWTNPSGEFGFDTVSLGQDEDPVVVNDTVVVGYAAFATTDYWIGSFGLNPQATNFSNFTVETPSFMTLLYDQMGIPSKSCGYTAGAYYKRNGNGAVGSLTLGGYDQGRFEPNNVSFQFGTNNQRSLLVGVQAITASTSQDSNLALASGGFYAAIDSTVTQLWLPLDVCQEFERAFGLQFNATTDLYLVNETEHQSLLNLNPTVTFTLGNTLGSRPAVNITLPYSAFDLKVQYPYQNVPYQCVSSNCYYFPLRRAANDTQLTLGKTFLQEAYLSIDWERSVFNVSQCVWNGDGGTNSPDIVTILPPGSSNPSSSSSSSSLSTGAYAGIAVGVVVVALGVCVAAFFYFRRRRNQHRAIENQKAAEAADSDRASSTSVSDARREHPLLQKPELDATQSYSGAEVEDKAATAVAAFKATSPTSPRSPGWIRTPEGTLVPASQSSAGATRDSAAPSLPPVEAEAIEREIFEMPGDHPAPNELPSPGQMSLSPKEEAIERERIYNGVDPRETGSDISPVTQNTRSPLG